MAYPMRAEPIRLESRPGRMVAVDAVGFLFGALLLAAARLVPQLVSPLAFWLLLASLAAAFGIDVLAWFHRGIRAIELDGETLMLRRGRWRSSRSIGRASVVRVRSRRSWGGQAIEIRLRPAPPRGSAGGFRSIMTELAARLSRRDRVMLRDDAFDREAFASLAGLLVGWNRRGG